MKLQTKFTIIGVLSASLVLGLAFITEWSFNITDKQSERMRLDATVIQRHMESDMMHDAIRSDVLMAQIAAMKGDANGINQARIQFGLHYDTLKKNFTDNQAENLPVEVKNIFAKTFPEIESYHEAAQMVLDAIQGQRNPVLFMKDFEDKFSKLEKSFEEISNDLTKVSDQDRSHAEASADILNTIGWTISIVALLGSISVPVFARIFIFKPQNASIQVMQQIAAGRTDVQVPGNGRRDEIGEMAKAIEVFKHNAIQKNRQEQEKAEMERKMQQERKNTMQQLVHAFQSRVQGIIGAVAAAATQLAQTAESMAKSITESTHNVQNAVTNASETYQNVQTVAAAAEQMSATIQEISTQTQNGGLLITDSVEKVKGADAFANNLQQASRQVRSVIQLISSISNQINLLALNATIESARAGEAGKGFAVVANEVRNLAGQTDKSIQDIEKVITDMSHASEGVIAALGGIKESVDKIYISSTGIASAVEEQSAVVNDIAQNMNTASNKTQSLKDNVKIVGDLSLTSEASSQQVLQAAQELSRQAEQLGSELESFLSEIVAG